MNTPAIESEFGLLTSEEHELPFLREWQANGNRIFAFLDACDEPLIPPKVLELGARAISLYRGLAEQEYAYLAPYVVEVDEELIAWIQEALAGTPWGYFMLTGKECSLLELRKHFRRFLTVKLPDQKKVLFRFYDPRVISTFLETTEKQDLSAFFGPVDSFCLIIPDSGKFTRIHRL